MNDERALRDALGAMRPAGEGVVLVPTMGALHEGHLALVRRGSEVGRPLVVTVFVNPTQFGPGEDLDAYPRTLEADLEALGRLGTDVAFVPGREVVYPPGVEITVPPLPAVARGPGLEDARRPGHFAGVCQVVARLLDLVRPAVAVFGEKDFQQLRVIEAMVAQAAGHDPDRWGTLRIEPHPTVREADGLALSSRNRYLDGGGRAAALGLSRALAAATAARSPEAAEAVMHETLDRHGLVTDYAAVRDAGTLLPIESFDRPARALVAARLGRVRLIDNCALPTRAAR